LYPNNHANIHVYPVQMARGIVRSLVLYSNILFNHAAPFILSFSL